MGVFSHFHDCLTVMHLISFLGTADGLLASDYKGPILTAVTNLKPDSITLIVTENATSDADYVLMFRDVKKAIGFVAPEVTVKRVIMELQDPTDHNEIYPKLRKVLAGVTAAHSNVTAAISSGTPAMQVCWILLAESQEANIKLVRTTDPRHGKKTIHPVKLAVGLPRIQTLELENSHLVEVAIPSVVLNVAKGIVTIGDHIAMLSPRMFEYYRYFLEMKKSAGGNTDTMLKVRGAFVGGDFSKKIVEYHEESFPQKEDEEISKLKKHGNLDIESTVFRSTISKLNKRICEIMPDSRISFYLTVQAVGPKSARQYFVRIPASKISIV